MHVLLVADKPHEALRLKGWLISGLGPGHEVEHLDNLNEALIQMQVYVGAYDVLIVDLKIPPDHFQLAGLTLAQASAPAMAIVVVSEEVPLDIISTAIRSGAQEYYVKSSLNAERFAQIVTKVVNDARSRAEAIQSVQQQTIMATRPAIVLCELSPVAVELLARHARSRGKTTQATLEELILATQATPDVVPPASP